MDTMMAFMNGDLNRHKELMVFDWVKAAQIIAERKPTEVTAGLSGDMEWTAGTIFKDGLPSAAEHTYVYLASTWATPVLVLDDGEEIACFKMQKETPNWNSDTFWPEEARQALSVQSD